MPNPFTPTLGVTPPLLVGRDKLISDFEYALDNGVGDPARSIVIRGERGTGKSVVLQALESVARDRNWEVIREAANIDLKAKLQENLLPNLLAKISSQSAAETGADNALNRDAQAGYHFVRTLRSRIEEITQILGEQQRGLLIALDDISLEDSSTLNEIFAAVQHGFRQCDQLAIVVAGLSPVIDDMLDLEPSTFMRRSYQTKTAPVTFVDATRALSEPLRDHGVMVDDEILEVAVRRTLGYPHLIQAIGFELYEASRGGEAPVSLEMVEVAVERALESEYPAE